MDNVYPGKQSTRSGIPRVQTFSEGKTTHMVELNALLLYKKKSVFLRKLLNIKPFSLFLFIFTKQSDFVMQTLIKTMMSTNISYLCN